MSTAEFTTALVELEPNLERFAYSLTANPDDARDLLQETFLKALTYKDKFQENTNIKAWTFTIMKNTFINDYRRRIKRQTMFGEEVHEFVINNKPADYGIIKPGIVVPQDTFRIKFLVCKFIGGCISP